MHLDLYEKLRNEDKYDPETDLRSKIIEMFYKEGFALTDEQKAASGVHLEFKEGDDIVKVFIG